jgi:Cdc37 Hsp90 binding domain
VEVLNPPKADAQSDSLPTVSSGAEADSEGSEAAPTEEEMVPTVLGKKFGEIKIVDLRKSMNFIEDHPEIVSERNQDGLMVSAFNAQLEGKESLGKQYVHQALLIQYVKQVGRGGVKTFFQGYPLCAVDLILELRILAIKRTLYSMMMSILPTRGFVLAQGRFSTNEVLEKVAALNKFNCKPLILIPQFTSTCLHQIRMIQKYKRHARTLKPSHLACNVR